MKERGFVKWFNAEKGYGFLQRVTGEDVFVHFTAIQVQGYRPLKEGMEVEFEVKRAKNGLQAENVSVLEDPKPAETLPAANWSEDSRCVILNKGIVDALLAEKLVSSLSEPERKALAHMTLFELAVPVAVVTEMAQGAPVENLVSLGLLNKHVMDGEVLYRVSTVVEPLLSSAMGEAEWNQARRRAARTLHEAWWDDKELYEARGLEVARVALAAGEQELAISTSNAIATTWVCESRYLEAVALARSVLATFDDYRILETLAFAENALGEIEAAKSHYERALSGCHPSDERRKSSIASRLAEIVAQEGDVERALQLWQQCLEITERTDGVEGMQARGAALHSIAEVIAQQGDVEGALQLWQQSLEIKEHVGDLQGKATTLHDMAVIIAQYGDVQRAFQLWQQSLEIKERIGDVKGKGATLFHMGRAVAEQGDVERALQLWQESLAIMESIGDEQGKGANLHHIAEVIARRGDAEQALQLWQESLEIDQRIGNVRGQAATLTSMAWAAGESGDHARRDQLNLQAARALGSVRAYLDMVTVLDNLASSAEQDREIFAAQAAWLVMKVQAPVDDSIGVLRRLFAQAPEGGRLERLIGAAAMIIVTTRGEDHPKHEQLHRQGFEMLSIAAGSAGIQDQEAFEQWLSEGRLTDSAHVFPALLASLEELVGDGWLFDRAPVQEYADSTSVG